jgi:hypothetical protein
MRGSEIPGETRPTRRTHRERNLKRSLLRHTRSLYTGIRPGLQRTDALYRLAELSKPLTLWVSLREYCDYCDSSAADPISDRVLAGRAKQETIITKVVLRGLAVFPVREAIDFFTLIPRSKTISVIMRPEMSLAAPHLTALSAIQSSQEPVSHRRIFLDSGGRYSYDPLRDSTPERFAKETCDAIASYCATCTCTTTVDVYFMSEISSSNSWDLWSPLRCKNLVQAELERMSKVSSSRHLHMVTVKTRADYLAETVKDEYGEEDLEFFRQTEWRAEEREREREKEKEREKEGDGVGATKSETAVAEH